MSMSEPAPHQTSGPHGIFEKAPVSAPPSAHAPTHHRQPPPHPRSAAPVSPAPHNLLSKTIRARKSGSRPADVHVGDNNG